MSGIDVTADVMAVFDTDRGLVAGPLRAVDIKGSLIILTFAVTVRSRCYVDRVRISSGLNVTGEGSAWKPFDTVAYEGDDVQTIWTLETLVKE